jgi:hypothetical protein
MDNSLKRPHSSISPERDEQDFKEEDLKHQLEESFQPATPEASPETELKPEIKEEDGYHTPTSHPGDPPLKKPANKANIERMNPSGFDRTSPVSNSSQPNTSTLEGAKGGLKLQGIVKEYDPMIFLLSLLTHSAIFPLPNSPILPSSPLTTRC